METENSELNENQVIHALNDKYTVGLNVRNSWQFTYDYIDKILLKTYDRTIKNLGVQGQLKQNLYTLYTSVGKYAVNGFVSNIISNICPVNSNFIKLQILNDDGVPYQDNNVTRINAQLNHIKNNSNFDEVMVECFKDLIAGTFCLMINPSDRKSKVVDFKCIPFKDYVFTLDTEGNMNYFFRELSMKGEDIAREFAYLSKFDSDSLDLKKDYSLKECHEYDYEKQKWRFIIYDESKIYYYSNNLTDTCPFVVCQWFNNSTEWYGKGPGFDVLNDFRQLNDLYKTIYKIINSLQPTYLATRTGLINGDIKFGDINPIETNDTGQPSLQQLDVKVDGIQYFFTLEQQLKQNIYKGLNAINIASMQGTSTKTATEVNEMVNELSNDLLNTYAIISKKFLPQVIRRFLECCQAKDLFKKDFKMSEIDDRKYSIKVDTPLMKVYEKNLPQIFQVMQLISQFDPNLEALNKTELETYMMTDTVPETCIYTADQIAQNKAEAQAMAQQG
jgi:hypothetical protein